MNISDIFRTGEPSEFNSVALELFRRQYHNNKVYKAFCDHLNKSDKNVSVIPEIPFLPIEFFKQKRVISDGLQAQLVFTSSGTTGSQTSKHMVADPDIYQQSFLKSFHRFYGEVSDYCILALLPSYLERDGSSLVYMMNTLIEKSGHPHSGFYLDNLSVLRDKLIALDREQIQILLVGVSYALLDLIAVGPLTLRNTIIMETGGMKGRRREMVREELHEMLQKGFGVSEIHSEYGMTELLSQAYSKGSGVFETPPWMKMLCRDTEDPFAYQPPGKTGGINVIDFANIHSCSFIATQDLGRVYENGSFEVIGRFDHSDIRGCNLMVV
ncbi:MAG: acyl transferase [Eudoraea sp.]|nr:acyl transferase [Eudoraea sp.]